MRKQSARLKLLQKRERVIRRRNLARTIDLLWSSLRSHLADTVKSKEDKNDEAWQAECVREYAECIYVVAVELHELAKEDFPSDKFYAAYRIV